MSDFNDVTDNNETGLIASPPFSPPPSKPLSSQTGESGQWSTRPEGDETKNEETKNDDAKVDSSKVKVLIKKAVEQYDMLSTCDERVRNIIWEMFRNANLVSARTARNNDLSTLVTAIMTSSSADLADYKNAIDVAVQTRGDDGQINPTMVGIASGMLVSSSNRLKLLFGVLSAVGVPDVPERLTGKTDSDKATQIYQVLSNINDEHIGLLFDVDAVLKYQGMMS